MAGSPASDCEPVCSIERSARRLSGDCERGTGGLAKELEKRAGDTSLGCWPRWPSGVSCAVLANAQLCESERGTRGRFSALELLCWRGRVAPGTCFIARSRRLQSSLSTSICLTCGLGQQPLCIQQALSAQLCSTVLLSAVSNDAGCCAEQDKEQQKQAALSFHRSSCEQCLHTC